MTAPLPTSAQRALVYVEMTGRRPHAIHHRTFRILALATVRCDRKAKAAPGPFGRKIWFDVKPEYRALIEDHPFLQACRELEARGFTVDLWSATGSAQSITFVDADGREARAYASGVWVVNGGELRGSCTRHAKGRPS